MSNINETLDGREAQYGAFIGQASLCQSLKYTMHRSDNWKKLEMDQREALEMIQHKVARILNGDPDYADNWHDIAGYATLVERQLNLI